MPIQIATESGSSMVWNMGNTLLPVKSLRPVRGCGEANKGQATSKNWTQLLRDNLQMLSLMDMAEGELVRGGGPGTQRQSMHDDFSYSGDREAAAEYVAELTRDLAAIARSHGLDALGYILEMARLEAQSATRNINGRR